MKSIKKRVKKYNWKDIFQRMFFSFIQGMVLYLSSTLNGMIPKTDAQIKSLIFATLMAGLSAVMNLIAQEMEMRK